MILNESETLVGRYASLLRHEGDVAGCVVVVGGWSPLVDDVVDGADAAAVLVQHRDPCGTESVVEGAELAEGVLGEVVGLTLPMVRLGVAEIEGIVEIVVHGFGSEK